MGEEADRIVNKTIDNGLFVGKVRQLPNLQHVFDSHKGGPRLIGQALNSGDRGHRVKVQLHGAHGVYLMIAAGRIEAGNAVCVSEDGRAVYTISTAAPTKPSSRSDLIQFYKAIEHDTPDGMLTEEYRDDLQKLFENQRTPEEIREALRNGEARPSANRMVCKFCQKTNLHWGFDMGKRRLREESGFLHDCGRSQVEINLPKLV